MFQSVGIRVFVILPECVLLVTTLISLKKI